MGIRMHRWSGWAALALFATIALPACDDGFGPDRALVEDTAEIFSLSRPENIGLPAAYDLTQINPRPVEVEDERSTGQWDIALTESDGGLVLAPASHFSGQGNAILSVDTTNTFAGVTEAPEDTSAYNDEPETVRTGAVYVVRSRRRSRCVYFSKLRPLEIDEEAGSLRFEFVLNPNCNARTFEPAEDD